MGRIRHPHSIPVLLLWVSVATIVVALPHTTAAAEIVDLRVGFDGYYKTGAWTPVAVTIKGSQEATQGNPKLGHLSITAADDEGAPCEFDCRFPKLANIPSAGQQTVTGYVCVGRRPTSLTVRLKTPESVVTETWLPRDERVIASTQQWVLLIGATENVFEVARLLDRRPGEEVRVLHLKDVGQLPRHWFGLRAFDLIVFCGGQPTAWQQVQPVQWDAIDRWAKLGGQLMLCVGENANELLGADGPAARFVPGNFVRRTIVSTTTHIEAFAGAAERLDLILQSLPPRSGGAEQGGLPMAMIHQPRGEVSAAEPVGDESIPIIIRDLYGLGQVTFVALDLDSEALRRWSGRTRFILRLLDLTINKRIEQQIDVHRGRVSHLGYSDIMGQLRAALQQFPGVRLVPFVMIGCFATLYVLLIGPGDYFLLRKLSISMQWSWLSFPLIAVAVCCLAIYLSNRWKGNQPRINQVDLVDWDVTANVIRGANWTHCFSPSSIAFDGQLSFTDVFERLPAPDGSLLSWDGLPGQSFGGMDGRSPLSPYSRQYSVSLTSDEEGLTSRIRGLSIPVASSRAIRADWWCFDTSKVDVNLQRAAGGYLQGAVSNPFGAELRECVLLYNRWFYRLGRIAADATVTIETQSPGALKSLLVRRRAIDEETRTMAAWDQRSFDVPRIMEMIMFHDAAGGREYTGLVHRHAAWLDLSRHIAAGRAILIGRVSAGATSLIKSAADATRATSG